MFRRRERGYQMCCAIILISLHIFLGIIGVDGFSPSSLSRSTTCNDRASFLLRQQQHKQQQRPPHRPLSRLAAALSFSGDSQSSMQWNAPAESVQEWLQSPASDFDLMGTKDARKQQQSSSSDDLWDCRQPRIDFLGVDLVPIFVNKLTRTPPDAVTVSIIKARTEIAGRPSSANRVVASLLEKSKFTGKSRIRARKIGSGCTVSVDLNLTLEVPLPPFILLPPGFNSIGSSIIRRTGESRTKQLLPTLQQAYETWAAEQKKQQQQQEADASEVQES